MNAMLSKIKQICKHHDIECQLLFCLFIFVGLVCADRFFLGFQTKKTMQNWKSFVQQTREKQQAAFFSMLDQHTHAQDLQYAPAEVINKHPLTGEQAVHILLTGPSSVTLPQIQPLIKEMQKDEKDNPKTFSYINTFVSKQAKKHNAPDFTLHLYPQLDQLFTVKPTKVGDFAVPWNKDDFAVTNLQKDFEAIVEEHLLPTKDRDIVVFLFFDNRLVRGESAERFYEYKTFRSFADEDMRRIYVNVYNFSPEFAGELNKIIIHELLHMYGANDKYLESKYGCKKEGFGNPYKFPLYPQTKADIMCGHIALSEDQYMPAKLENDSLIINSVTAKEIGWVKKDNGQDKD